MKEKIYKTDYKLLHNNYVNDERILYEKMFVVLFSDRVGVHLNNKP